LLEHRADIDAQEERAPLPPPRGSRVDMPEIFTRLGVVPKV